MMLSIFFTIFIFFNVFFLIAVKKKDFSVIDIGWGLSFLVIYLTALSVSSDAITTREMIVGGMVTLWALRLSSYLFYRWFKKGKEDYRYTAMRLNWGENANQTAYVRVFMLQMVLSLVIASPLILLFAYSDHKAFGALGDWAGLGLWFIGFMIESFADYQKNAFKKDPSNQHKFCQIGLWKYSRHPNYFGESLVWWGIFLVVSSEVPFYFAFWGPLFLNFLLLKVSGVSLLEQEYIKRPGFEEYKKRTNRFIPWFRKNNV